MNMPPDLRQAAVPSMTRNMLGDLEMLKSAYAKLEPADDPPPTPPIRVKPLGLTPSQRR